MRTTITAAVAFLTLAAGSAFSLADIAQQPAPGASPYAYTYHKEVKPLALDATRIAIRADDADTIRAALVIAKLPTAKVEPHGLIGWWMVSEFGLLDAPGIEQAVAALATAPNIRFASPVFFDEFGGPMFPTSDLLIGFVAGQSPAQRDAFIADTIKATPTQRDWMPDVDVFTAESRNGFDILRASNTLAASAKTLFAEPDMIFSGRNSSVPNDPQFSQLWGLNNFGQSGGLNDFDMDVPEAWDVHAGSSAIIDVVLDNGVDLTHPDLNLAPGNDFTGNNTLGGPGNNCDNHGTAVAGCISARMNNSTGVVGVAPGCRVAPARCFVSTLACDGSWNSQASYTVNALSWAQTIGARVTNNSNGYGFTSASIDTAYTNTRNAGIVHFASAGNNGTGTLGYPARLNFVNGIASLNRFGNRSGFSQYGPNLDFSAPGESINTTDRQGNFGYVAGDYAVVDGTSFASPYASAVACLLLSRNSGLTPQGVEDIMAYTSTDLGAAGYDNDYGFGLVNAQRALNFIVPPGDGCSSAVDVPFGVYSNTLVGAGNPTFVGGVCGSAGGNPDVWYRYVAPLTGTLFVHTCGSNDASGIDTVLSLHTSCNASAVACSDDAIGECGTADAGTPRDSYLARSMNAGEAILIRVSKFNTSAVGPFTLTVGFAAANDSCANATNVSAGGTYYGHLRYTSNDQNFATACGSSQTNPDAWYVYTAPAGCPTTLNVSTCGTHDAAGLNTGMDTVISLHTACGTEPIACNDDASGGECGSLDTSAIRDSFLSRSIAPGSSIYIRVSKYSSATPGPFQLNISTTSIADFNHSGTITVQDIFDFLAAYFNNAAAADVNGSGTVTVQDIFDFLSGYFANC